HQAFYSCLVYRADIDFSARGAISGIGHSEGDQAPDLMIKHLIKIGSGADLGSINRHKVVPRLELALDGSGTERKDLGYAKPPGGFVLGRVKGQSYSACRP